MRVATIFLGTIAALFASSSAFAGSIDTVASGTQATVVGSVMRIGCANCPPPVQKKKSYSVPKLKNGQQILELRNVAGKQKLFRTEAWLGGSPVTFVSVPTDDEISSLEKILRDPHDPMGDGIDTAAKTAAVGETPAGPMLKIETPVAATLGAPAPHALNTSDYSLRP